MKGIFISYRRDDTSGYARSLYERLGREFGPDQIFMDVETLREPGMDFVDALETGIGQCSALIALIGKNWLASEDRHGRRRLDNENDFVRNEIAAALKRDTRVIPVLVQGARMPEAEDLPDDLAPLARRTALTLSHEDWEHDIGKLIVALDKLPDIERQSAAGAAAAAPAAPAPPPRSSTTTTVALAVCATLVLVFIALGWIGYSLDDSTSTSTATQTDPTLIAAEPPEAVSTPAAEPAAPAIVTAPAPPAAQPEPQPAQSTSSTETVRFVQEALAQLGYDPGPADGTMGAATRSAIREFQDDEGYAVTGRITPELQQQLADASLAMLEDEGMPFDMPAVGSASAGNLTGTWYDDAGTPFYIEQMGNDVMVGSFDILTQQLVPTAVGIFQNGRLLVQYTNNLGQSGTVTAQLSEDGRHLNGTDTDAMTGTSTSSTWHREHLPGQ